MIWNLRQAYCAALSGCRDLPEQTVPGSSYVIEYPLPYKEGQAQYEKYKALAERIPNLICCGRLADFKYYNMDQALERAMACVKDMSNKEDDGTINSRNFIEKQR